MQRMADRGSSKQKAQSEVRELTSESEYTAPSQTLSSLRPNATRTTPSSHKTSWIKNLSEKLKIRRGKSGTPRGKVARVETPDPELTNVEYFRACLHYFNWTMPSRAQLRKCFTNGFSKALLRNVTPTNRSGQCFLAFVIHEAKKFLDDQNIRTNTVNLEHCLRAVLQKDVAGIVVQTISTQRLHSSRDLARTQCLHDRSFPDWISFIAERVLLNQLLTTRAREGLSVLLSTLDLHASIRLSDGASQRLAPDPWSKSYMKIARKLARRKSPHPRVIRTQSPNPFTAPPTSASRNQNPPGNVGPNDDDQDESSAIFDPDIARQHLEALQSSNEPTQRLQVFRNGAPHSLYATETMLQADLRDLKSRLEAQRAYLQTASTVASNLADAGPAGSRSSKNHTCMVGVMLRKKHLFVHGCGRSKSKAKPQPRPQPRRNKVAQHRGPPAEQERTLKELRANILELQRRKKLSEEEYEWRQGHQPRKATIAIPSRRAAKRARRADPATSPGSDSRPKASESLRGGASQDPARDPLRRLSPESQQRRVLGPIRIPSNDPPTYAQSERASQRGRDRVSPSRLKRWSGSFKRLLRRMGLKTKEDKDAGGLVPRGRSRSPRA